MFKKEKDTMVVVVFSGSKDDSVSKLQSILKDAGIKRGYDLKVLDSSIEDKCTCIEVKSAKQKVFTNLVDLCNIEYAIVG